MLKRFLFSSIGVSLIIACAIIGAGIFLKAQSAKPSTSLQAKIDAIAQNSIKNAIQTGQLESADWEKALKIANGTSTIDEKIAELQKTAPVTDEKPENLTATDRFTRALLEKYVEFKSDGGVIDNNTTLELVNELITKDYGGPDGEKIYTESDIILLNTSALGELKKYGNLMGLAITEPVSAGYENEIVIINRVYETDDSSDLKKLEENLARYQSIRNTVSSIPVPIALKNAHIATLNSLSAIIEGIRGMLLIEEDPIGATTLMLRYEEGLRSLDTAFVYIGSYLKNKNVSFSSTESGYLFYK